MPCILKMFYFFSSMTQKHNTNAHFGTQQRELKKILFCYYKMQMKPNERLVPMWSFFNYSVIQLSKLKEGCRGLFSSLVTNPYKLWPSNVGTVGFRGQLTHCFEKMAKLVIHNAVKLLDIPFTPPLSGHAHTLNNHDSKNNLRTRNREYILHQKFLGNKTEVLLWVPCQIPQVYAEEWFLFCCGGGKERPRRKCSLGHRIQIINEFSKWQLRHS